MRIPKHIGIIPDGNRRWAKANGLEKEQGYQKGIFPGMELFRLCEKLGIEELTFYGFTVDNTKRPGIQRRAFTDACVEAVKQLEKEDASLLVVGNTESAMFPTELKKYAQRRKFNKGTIKVNFLVNYSWEWDLGLTEKEHGRIYKTDDISRIDLIIRWGARRRLSGFLPVQSVYSDIYVTDIFWPDFNESQVYQALEWYSKQDITLGG